jgi:hypothetical protein
MQSFLRKTWNATAKTSSFDEANIPNLAAELEDKVREAEVEWRRIDQDLLKIITAETSAGLLAAGPLVAAGHAQWVGGFLCRSKPFFRTSLHSLRAPMLGMPVPPRRNRGGARMAIVKSRGSRRSFIET